MNKNWLFRVGMRFLRKAGNEGARAWDAMFYENNRLQMDISLCRVRQQHLKDAFRELLGAANFVDAMMSSQNSMHLAQSQLRVAIIQAKGFEKML